MKKKALVIAGVLAGLVVIGCLVYRIFSPTESNISVNFDNSDINTIVSAGQEINLDNYSDGSVIKITSAGEYIVSGTLNDGQVYVEVGDSDKVQLYLNNASITNSNSSAVYVANADKVVITLNENTMNYVTDGASYTEQNADSKPDAAIFSHDDLTINGDGALVVKGNYEDGITSRDDLKIAGGNITISAKDDGLFGNKSVEIKSAILDIASDGDAIHSDGDMVIESGTFAISAGDDSIHADGNLVINDGAINIKKSYEGIEATNVTINGGTIDITATDDGINGAGGVDDSGASTPYGGRDSFSSSTGSIAINGGTITIAAATSGNGDGLDSNGPITITGGDMVIKTPARTMDYEPIDYETNFSFTGGRVRTLSTGGVYTEITSNYTARGGGGMMR